jgi:hypothetical protein
MWRTNGLCYLLGAGLDKEPNLGLNLVLVCLCVGPFQVVITARAR